MSLSRFGDWLASTRMGATRWELNIDMAFRRALLLSELFTKSWGDPKILKQLAKHKKEIMSQRKVMEMNDSLKIDMTIDKISIRDGIKYMEGHFISPHAIVYPEQLPNKLQFARWSGIFPTKLRKALCIHMAGTGDHSYWRRKIGFADYLLEKEGMASIMLQNPFYTDRKPEEQFRSSLHNVSDLFVMGAALMSECNYLANWAKKEGFGPIIFSGVSMGGFMAALAASNAPSSVGVVPILSHTTAGPSYTEGAITQSIPYKRLQNLLEDKNYIEKLRKIPDVNWVDEMYTKTERNGKSLSYNMMRILMDEFTLLSNYPVPFDTSKAHVIIAEEDGYVIRNHGSPNFHEVWPGVKVETMKGVGHVWGYLRGHDTFRNAIANVSKL